MTNEVKKFTRNLKAYRNGISINELAKITGIPQPTLNRYQQGKSEPTLTNLVKIAKALEITVNDLIE